MSGTFVFSVELVAFQRNPEDLPPDTPPHVLRPHIPRPPGFQTYFRQECPDYSSGRYDIQALLRVILDHLEGQSEGGTRLAAGLLGHFGDTPGSHGFYAVHDRDNVFEANWDGVRRSLFWNFVTTRSHPGARSMVIQVAPSNRLYSFGLLIHGWRMLFEHPRFRPTNLVIRFDYSWIYGVHSGTVFQPRLVAHFPASDRYITILAQALQFASNRQIGRTHHVVAGQLMFEMPHMGLRTARNIFRALFRTAPRLARLRLGYLRGRTPLTVLSYILSRGAERFRCLPDCWGCQVGE